MPEKKPRIRLLGAVVSLALAVDHGDGGDLQPLQTDPIQLNPQGLREFAAERLDAEIAALETRLAACQES